jgi:hypothetical protein
MKASTVKFVIVQPTGLKALAALKYDSQDWLLNSQGGKHSFLLSFFQKRMINIKECALISAHKVGSRSLMKRSFRSVNMHRRIRSEVFHIRKAETTNRIQEAE